ncbi:unnamed protein product [Onchocerca flexuosa]|uniref:Uncharacterized protein n=1 Tax=Onchocerca flexuosa TaxID=387005 RepID=A0A183HTH1_9BILA|nr:unnamed protein product [Onchocerca flexuosa]
MRRIRPIMWQRIADQERRRSPGRIYKDQILKNQDTCLAISSVMERNNFLQLSASVRLFDNSQPTFQHHKSTTLIDKSDNSTEGP